jgi:hypothetical protein
VFVGFEGPDVITEHEASHTEGPDVITETENQHGPGPDVITGYTTTTQHGEGDPVAQHGEGANVVTGHSEGNDIPVDNYEAGEYFTHEGADVQTHEAATDHPGGSGGTGYTGQRGGRGGGGVLIVVTRDAGTPTYTFNTGVNGQLIALDTANI